MFIKFLLICNKMATKRQATKPGLSESNKTKYLRIDLLNHRLTNETQVNKNKA